MMASILENFKKQNVALGRMGLFGITGNLVIEDA
jgi:hypothetical protein